jgi:hypothetical protein
MPAEIKTENRAIETIMLRRIFFIESILIQLGLQIKSSNRMAAAAILTNSSSE